MRQHAGAGMLNESWIVSTQLAQAFAAELLASTPEYPEGSSFSFGPVLTGGFGHDSRQMFLSKSSYDRLRKIRAFRDIDDEDRPPRRDELEARRPLLP